MPCWGVWRRLKWKPLHAHAALFVASASIGAATGFVAPLSYQATRSTTSRVALCSSADGGTMRVKFIDASAPGGYGEMELPSDFKEFVSCFSAEPLEPFLARHSALTAHANWVSVQAPGPLVPARDCSTRKAVQKEAVQTALRVLQSRGDAVTVSEVDQVARDTHLTSGKWKISVEAADLERTWGLIARAVHSGALGEACTSAKVSTTITQKLRARGSLHTVYVYTANYLDEQSVDQLRAGLQQLLLDGNAGASAATSTMAEFKPNIYTVMGWGDGRMPPLVPAARYTT